LKVELDFRATGCHGFCEKGPIVVIDPDEICYLQVTPDDVPEIIALPVENGLKEYLEWIAESTITG